MSRDLRKYAKQTNLYLLVGGIVLLFFVGDGLIYFFYGREAAISGLICLALGLMPIVVIWFILMLFQWLVRRAEDR